jgi:tetratricopeptide (TPR) repeat protein
MSIAPAFTPNIRFFALYLLDRGRITEALAVLDRALRTDPLDRATNLALATTYYWGGQADAAIEQLNRTLALDDPSSASMAAVHEILADVYESKGYEELAIARREQALRLNGSDEVALALRSDFTHVGFREAMRRFYKRQLEIATLQSVNTYVSPMYFAILYIHLGDPDRAFQWLDKAREERAPWLVTLRVDPVFSPIRSDPRFERLLRDVGIPR